MNTIARLERVLLWGAILIFTTEAIAYVIGQVQLGLPIFYR